MLNAVDTGVARITKREKMRLFYDRTLSEGMPNDQDAHLVNRDLNCFAVADGVGSSVNSAIAAMAVCEAYEASVHALHLNNETERLTQRNYVVKTIKRMNRAAVGALATTTFTGLAVHSDDTASYLHVGDSQLVMYRDDELVRCTSEQVRENGYQLLNYLGTQPEWASLGYGRHAVNVTVEANSFSVTKLEAEWGEIRLRNGDRFVLMTDGITGSGVHDRLDDRILKECLGRRIGAAACAGSLLAASRKEDDSTVVIVDIGYEADRFS